MLKGKCEIILTDNESGEETHHAVSDNIVTNAVNNLINGALDRIAGNLNNTKNSTTSLDYLFELPNSIAEDFFGGIILFSKKIEEDKKHCIPTKDEILSIVGYSGTMGDDLEGNIYRGRFNREESSFVNGEAKFVYEFDPGIATGDIACVALSSAKGCIYGLKNNKRPADDIGSSHITSIAYPSPFDKEDSNYFIASSPHSPMLTGLEFNDFYVIGNYAYVNDSSSPTSYRKIDCSMVNKKGFRLLRKFDEGAVGNYNEEVVVVDTEEFLPEKQIKNLDNSGLYCVTGNDTIYRLNDDFIADEIVVNTSKLVESLKEYGYNNNYPLQDIAGKSFIKDNKIYFAVGDVGNEDKELRPDKVRIYSLSIEGDVKYVDLSSSEIEMLFGDLIRQEGSNNDLSNAIIASFSIINDCLFITSNGSTGGKSRRRISLLVDEETLKLYDDITLYNPDPYTFTDYGYVWGKVGALDEPWFSCIGVPEGNAMFTIELWMNYLATINNLSDVIHKTADSKLKVIYTLTEA